MKRLLIYTNANNKTALMYLVDANKERKFTASTSSEYLSVRIFQTVFNILKDEQSINTYMKRVENTFFKN